jgi:hypothetical protein
LKWEETESKISKLQLENFYCKAGKLIAEFLGNLECPNCKTESDVDWLLESISNGKPQFICRNCLSKFPIVGLKFKTQKAEAVPLKILNPITEKKALK